IFDLGLGVGGRYQIGISRRAGRGRDAPSSGLFALAQYCDSRCWWVVERLGPRFRFAVDGLKRQGGSFVGGSIGVYVDMVCGQAVMKLIFLVSSVETPDQSKQCLWSGLMLQSSSVRKMFGGDNGNPVFPLFLGENQIQYDSNASTQLQLFGN
ncbi:hypothetical protein Taro_036113, partial [Colocasia esculenta]|nr:hypothetical protein [Colocasia esculenta]